MDDAHGELVDGGFPLHDLHARYAALRGGALVAELQADLLEASPETLADVSYVLGRALDRLVEPESAPR